MGNVKIRCAFCGKTNTKIQTVSTGGIFNSSSYEKEVIDSNITMYRCVGCGRTLCKGCMTNLGGRKVGVFSTKLKCPKCDSKVSRI